MKPKRNRITNEYNVKVFPQKNILSNIIHTRYNIDLIQGQKLFGQEENENPEKITQKILKIRNEYDFIIIDTSINEFPEYIREMARMSDKVILLSGANVLEIKKTKKILNMYENQWNLSSKKLKIVINKHTPLAIEDNVLKIILRNHTIIGKIKLSEIYDAAINRNNLLLSDTQKQIIKISDQIGGKYGTYKQFNKQSNSRHARA